MQCEGRRRLEPFEGRAWRVVEGQHRISTRRLVDSNEEQGILEELIDRAKPPPPRDCDGLHYLLATPFRYPPLLHGSRFGSRTERALWYGSLDLTTAFAEVAFYRLLFMEGTKAALEPLVVDLSAFFASLSTERAVDLTAPPFAPWQARISDPASYEASQALGTAMREDSVLLALYRSARDPREGKNVAVFSPSCFSKKRPSTPQTWLCVGTRAGVEFSRLDYFERRSFAFPRDTFEVDGRLPGFGLGA